MRGPTRIFGHRLMIAIWPMSLRIQSEIAKAIADQLQARLSPNEKAAIEKPPTTDLAAFDLYTRAKTLLLSTTFSPSLEQNLRQAVELLNQAVSARPGIFRGLLPAGSMFTHSLYSVGFDHTAGRVASAERRSSSRGSAAARCRRNTPGTGELSLFRSPRLRWLPWLNWKMRGAVYLTIRASSN